MRQPQGGPLPPAPKLVTIPTFSVKTTETGTTQVPATGTFFYAGIQAIWVWWLVDLRLLAEFVEPFALTPYDFGQKKGAVNVNFFNATAFYGQGSPGNRGIGGFNETEVNIVSYASRVGDMVPQGLAFQDYLTKGEQTKRVGNYRLWVACDDPVAVAFGRQQYFENKFLTAYQYSVPSPNNPGVTTWSWTCFEAEKKNTTIYAAEVDLRGQTGVPANMSEWIDISFDANTRRPVASRRNYFGLHEAFVLSKPDAVRLSIGNSRLPMRKDMDRLVGTARAAAVQRFTSPTCIGEASPYYADL